MRLIFWSTRRIKLAAGALLFAAGTAAVAGALIFRAAGKERSLPIYSVETDEKAVAVTFDCAWGDEDIPRLLDILEDSGAKATFFVLGSWAEKYPGSVRAIAAAGHELGNHSDTHPDMAACSADRIEREVLSAQEKIFAASGVKTRLFRAPSGSYGDLLIDTVRAMGYEAIQWDVDSIDWKDPEPEVMARRVLGKIRNGSILLFHSGAKNTPEALPVILAEIAKQGYRFLTVSQLVYAKNYVIDRDGRQKKVSGG